MNERIQQRINQLKKVATAQLGGENVIPKIPKNQDDSLSQAIRTEKDAKAFMSDLKSLIEKAR